MDHLLLRSIYFGGGTPSLLSPELLNRMIQTFTSGNCHPELEITIEANPETIHQSVLSSYHQIRINRISLGVQSLVDRELLALGRGHRSNQALQAQDQISRAGFKSYSLDLMIETPHQTIASWKHSLETLRNNPPPHLSLYNLVIEPYTVFAKAQSSLQKVIVGSEEGALMLQNAILCFENLGLERYEISAFAKPGHISIHNTGYWRGRTFIGLGPSAYSFYNQERLQNHCDLKKWSEDVRNHTLPISTIDRLSPKARQAELLAIHLRISSGINTKAFEERWGSLSSVLQESINNLKDQDMIQYDSSILKLTAKGQLYYEQVASELVVLED
jgi:oxygen-independent coproporphyrinogen-3 oxidase